MARRCKISCELLPLGILLACEIQFIMPSIPVTVPPATLPLDLAFPENR